MSSIDVETLFAILFVEIDDWYQLKGRQWLRGKVGRPAKFSDSEEMTLMLASEFLPFPSESQYLSYIGANHYALTSEHRTQFGTAVGEDGDRFDNPPDCKSHHSPV